MKFIDYMQLIHWDEEKGEKIMEKETVIDLFLGGKYKAVETMFENLNNGDLFISSHARYIKIDEKHAKRLMDNLVYFFNYNKVWKVTEIIENACR